jgi:hypothetical protein
MILTGCDCSENPMRYCNIQFIPEDKKRFVSGEYAGREIAVVRPKWAPDSLLIRYELTGRSDGSKAREMVFRDVHNDDVKEASKMYFDDGFRLYTMPLGEVTDDDRLYRNYKVAETLDAANIVIVTNGHQTRDLTDRARDDYESFCRNQGGLVKLVLANAKPEDDYKGAYATARIALAVHRGPSGFIVDMGHNSREKFEPEIEHYEMEFIEPGEGHSVSTYDPKTPWMDYPKFNKVQGYDSFENEVSEAWKAAKERHVIDRDGNKIPTLASMAWMLIPPTEHEGTGEILVKDVNNKFY